MKLVTQSEMSRIVGVSSAAIANRIRRGQLPTVAETGKIDIHDEVVRKYLDKRKVDPDNVIIPGPGAVKKKQEKIRYAFGYKLDEPITPDPEPDPPAPPPIPPELQIEIDKEVLTKQKLQSQIRELELKNAIKEGQLVSREVMTQGVWNPVQTFVVRMLSDGAKTMSKTVTAVIKSGGSREEVEVALRKEMTSHFQAMKEHVDKALKQFM